MNPASGTDIRRVWVETIMGTEVSVHARGTEVFATLPALDAAVEATFAELHRADAVFSTYRPDSDISQIRTGAFAIEDADPDVAEVADACALAEERTNGLFRANWRGWFDPTGYVKGWAVERAARRHLARVLSFPGASAVGINAGGDMRLFTADDSDWVWRVGIADPHHPGALVATVEVRNGAVATSGTAERGSHIVDPRTGGKATRIASATVVADSLTEADLWATVAAVSGDDLSWISHADTRSGVLVASDGGVRRWLGATEISVQPANSFLAA
ncbi:FAD:protein FMN transferase [Microbacterium sediminicola]|uniref:FAD:protein FMN transferase n=1 Tax=Microbacterium sediminicola TaxID=415210 RepID=A0ABP4TW73_9MICO